MTHTLSRSVRLSLLGATLLSPMFAVAQDTLTTELKDVDGQVVGEITLTGLDNGVLIDARLSGMPPGTHGFHIHETGNCDAATGFESAGGHLAGEREHGFLTEGGPHPGDMPNIHVPESGELHIEVVDMLLAFASSGSGAMLDEDGSALMVHSGADDYRSEPAGDAGKRIACAEINATR